jgi:predicted unusual protein kinase regulating ubiquinone biosynthesis (AarF/ABC1/UbiB family)
MLTTVKQKPLRWQRRRYSLIARQFDVFSVAVKFAADLWWDRTIAQNSQDRLNRRAQWLVGALLDLGPTFIKIGQALSTRADLLPLEYVRALQTLQDQVPAFPSQTAIAIIEAELGQPVTTLFRDFDEEPIAAASLGQVHRARLHTGEDIVIKVQRPGLDSLFTLDFKAVQNLIRLCQRTMAWTQQYELDEIYQEFFNVLYREIDYVQEGKNADRFRENFRNQPRIRVPKIYWQYTTRRVLAMEYLPGIKINDRQSLEACGIDPKELNKLGISSYLKQLLQDGFFQADPHPGNLAVSQQGDLIFYDFGMMSEVKPLAKGQMVKTFFAIMRKDTDEVVDSLVDMGLIVPVRDMTPVRRIIGFLLEKFVERPLEIKAFKQLRNELYAMFVQQPFRLPAQMTYIVKSLTTLDGIARVLDPDYSLMAGAQPFIRSLAMGARGQGNALGDLARQARDFVGAQLNKPSRAELAIQRLEERIEKGELELRVRSMESDRALKLLNLAVKSLIYACLTGFTLLSGTVLLLGKYVGWAIVAFLFAGLGFVMLVRSLIRLGLQERLDRLIE